VQIKLFLRAILRDEAIYPDPDTFKPTRFLNADGTLNKNVPYPAEGFGYGRRICPGRYFAQDVLFLSMANILAAFKLEKPVDELGNVVEPRAEFNPGLIR
jgi:cytochrome P450